MGQVLAQLAEVHRAQQGWRTWVRSAWWLFLLPVALACWTASRRGVSIKVVGWAAASFALLFYAAAVDASINPAPPAAQSAKVAAPAHANITNNPTSSSPTPTGSPTPEVSLAPPVTEVPTTPPPTTAVVVAPPPPAVAAVVPAVPRAVPPVPVRTTVPQPVVTHKTTAAAPAPGCTTTSSGKCIKGGEFCPVAKQGLAGYDASGDRYVCTDSDNNGHPHWE